MKRTLALLAISLFAEGPASGPSIPYFTNVREVHVVDPARQNFFVVDEEIWKHARNDLGDVRLYDRSSIVQYALSEQVSTITSDEVEARILNLGSVAGHTEFDLDTQGLPEYDRIQLRIDAHDFVATASVSGGSTPRRATEVSLPPSTLYDFTKEQLGSNAQLKLPPSSFPYLHIKLAAGITPQQVKGATIFDLHEQKASWTRVGSCSAPQQQGRITVIACDIAVKTPLRRISFQVAPSQTNFRRTVSVEDEKGAQIASGEIDRVRVDRAGTLVTSENLAVNVSSNPGKLTLRIDNGENPALLITSAEPLAVERRVYFDPQGKTTLKLYYGDEKLAEPTYDYSRFFHLEPSPAEAELGPGMHNDQYTGRPDDRPWSERHTTILWGAMLLAVLSLAILAIRGLGRAERK